MAPMSWHASRAPTNCPPRPCLPERAGSVCPSVRAVGAPTIEPDSHGAPSTSVDQRDELRLLAAHPSASEDGTDLLEAHDLIPVALQLQQDLLVCSP